ncbi:hypothetical protein OV203_12855 [Nannocystis sp. ILAH1]|uniref:hypothetical protein n=1 Tax=unclassified Nannocystis TaxID=2627009 RepID=UPI0022722BD7|nr:MULTISPECIES: hypothetical protein [unclassified Nannocystis]MCY0988019.1 hypothetical protein [Nannocystis sp. ILAH1]MCY1065638.1 hypothetical protein [Nannocystis sp. RBIL2]
MQLLDATVFVDQHLGVQEAVGEAALDCHGLADGDELAAPTGAAGLDQRPAGRVSQDELVAEELGDLTVHCGPGLVREAADRHRRHERLRVLRPQRAQAEEQALKRFEGGISSKCRVRERLEVHGAGSQGQRFEGEFRRSVEYENAWRSTEQGQFVNHDARPRTALQSSRSAGIVKLYRALGRQVS